MNGDATVQVKLTGERVKLKNRRVFVARHGADEWYVQFKRLVDRKKREIAKVSLLVSHPAMLAMIGIVLKRGFNSDDALKVD